MPENSVLSRMKRKMSENGIGRDTWMVVISLLLIFFLAIFLRTYFGLGEATQYGAPYLVSGGSDSYYHERAIYTAAYEHHALMHDPMLNYPLGAKNPRPAGYDWSVMVMGYILAPFLGGDLLSALSYSLIFSSVIWGALTVFPVYLIGKKVFNRRVGLISAFFIAIMPAHMQRSQLTYADHDPFVLFFVVLSIYFILVSLEKLKENEWVDNWRSFESIKTGLSTMKKENREAFLYAGLSAAASVTVALTWKGFSYLYLILAVYFFIQMFINRFKNTDSTSLTVVSFITLGLPLILAFPYYFLSHQLSWMIAPVSMAVGVIVLGLIFSLTIRYPWTLVIPGIVAALIISVLTINFLDPQLIQTVGNQTGYFTHSKVYKTIAEAQAPMISNMVLSFGPTTFFLSMLGMAWIIWKIRKNWSPFFVFFAIWSAESIYMALSAARFMFNAAPAFAIASAFLVHFIIKQGDFSSIKKTYRSLSGNKMYAIKKSIKPRHVVISLFLVFLVVMPNVWYAVDAGIPYQEKKEYDLQVYNTMPDFMRPNSTLYNASNHRSLWYFGAFGYQLPTPDQYWPAAWSWFRTQDSNLLPEDRPGFLSWWDYGFECIQQGQHPAVADNFQHGYQIAGSFIMAQNETEAVALLFERLLDAEYNQDTGKFSDRAINVMSNYLTQDEIAEINDIYNHPRDYLDEIQSNPGKYGPYDSDMNDLNIRYVATRGILQHYSTEHLVEMLKDMEDTTGHRISYFAIDSRLIPFSAQNTGIFYAPAVLSDRRITEGSYRIPYDFYMIYAITKYGKKYPINEVPDDEKNDIDHTEIEYTDMFYNTMLYRNYFGYSPKEVGIGDNGLPGLSDNLKNNMPMPGWNMTHFRLVYRTAYWNPYKDYKNHTDAWRAVSLDEARKYQEEGKGIVDMSPSTLYNGVTFMEYYEGAFVNGTVLTPEGNAVGNVRVTIYDEYGIPHQSVMTDKNGRYSILAPFGNDTLLVSNGGSLNKIRLSEKNMLNATRFRVERYQAWRERCDMDGDGKWDYLIEKDPVVSTSTVSGSIFIDSNNDGSPDGEQGVPANVTLYGKNVQINYTVTANATGAFSFGDVVPGDYGISYEFRGFSRTVNTTISVEPSKPASQDIAIPTGAIKGVVRYPNGNLASNVNIRMYAVDSRNTFNFTTDKNGAYYINAILPGVYQIDAVSENLTTSNTRFGVADNQTSFENFTVYPGTTVDGYVVSSGRAIPYVEVNFINYTLTDVCRSVITDKNGYFSVKIAKGRYSIYATYLHESTDYAVLRSEYIDSPKTLDLEMEKCYEVNGYIKYRNWTNPRITLPISFVNSEGARLDVYSLPHYNYSVSLPAGTYHVYVASEYAKFPYAYSTQISVPETKNLDIDLLEGAHVRGYVNGVENMSVPYARVSFEKDQQTFETFTDRTGYFEYYLLPGDYTMDVSAAGYKHTVMDISATKGLNPMQNVTLTAMSSTVRGTVYLGDSPAPGINISFYGYNHTYNTTTDMNGNYSISLYGGRYFVRVSQYTNEEHNEKYELTRSEYLYVNPYVTDIFKNLSIEVRYRVNGTVYLDGSPVNTTIYFSKGLIEMPYSTRNGSFDVYLPEGNYVVNSTYVSNATPYAIFSGINVSGPRSVNLSFEPAHHLSVEMISDGRELHNIPLNITVGGATRTLVSNSTLDFSLPAGTYTLSVNYTHIETVENIDRNVTYTAHRDIDLQSDKSVMLDVERYVPQGSLHATVKIGSMGVNDASVVLRSEDNGTEYTFPVENGTLRASLPMGAYTVYSSAYAGDNPYALMENIVVGERTIKEFSMEPAAVFSGKATDSDGVGLKSGITAISLDNQDVQRNFNTSDNGDFSLVLPVGDYSLIFTAHREEYGINTTYMKNFDVNLTFNVKQDVVLDRMNTYKADLLWDNSERVTVEPGSTVIYNISVKNTGNTPDTFRFTAAPWKCDFDPESVHLLPGESTQVQVTIHVPLDAKVSHEPLRITASSEGASSAGTVIVDVGVIPVVSGEIGDVSEADWVNGNAIYSVEIMNTGNVENTFIVTPAERSELNAMGWDIALSTSKDGNYSDSVSLSIAANSSSPVYVKLIPIASEPSYDVDFSIAIHTTNGLVSEEKSIPAKLPSVEIKADLDFGDNGAAQVWKPKPLDLTPIYWAIGIVVFFAAVYVIMRKKGVIL